MDKTSEKITQDPKRVGAGCKGRENYMNKYKESILNDAKKGSRDIPMQAMKVPALLTMQAMKLPTLPTPLPPMPPALTTPPPQDQTILMSMALVCLLSLPLMFVYFLHITLFSLQIKNKSMKNRINHQNNVICFRKIYNK